MDAVIRPAASDDAEAIATVHIRTWQAAYRGQLPDQFLDQLSGQLRQRADFWRAHISNPPTPQHEVWVGALDKKHVEGFIAIGPARDADPKITGEVYAIYVEPENWGQGLGRMLMTQGARRLASLGFSAALLWVLESNGRARRFYEIAGWSTDGRTKIETRPDGIELREVSYKITLSQADGS